MPAVNVLFNNESHLPELQAMTPDLRGFIAEQLSCGDRSLVPGEVSVRLMGALSVGMIAPVEIDMFAAAYPERVKKQDEICLSVRKFVMEHVTSLEDAQVWLALSELGHSMED